MLGRSRRLFRVFLPVALASVSLSVVAPAGANHIPGATYNGTIDGGGTISFTLSPDGASVTTISIVGMPGISGCTSVDSSQMGSVPIVDHAFNDTGGPLFASGTFPGTQSAQGTVRFNQTFPTPCDTGTKNWTAMTTATPPPPPPVEPMPTAVEGVKAKAKPTKVIVSGMVSPAAPGAQVVATLFAKSSPFKKVAKRKDTLDDAGAFKVKFPNPATSVRCKVQIQFKGDAEHLASKTTKKFAC